MFDGIHIGVSKDFDRHREALGPSVLDAFSRSHPEPCIKRRLLKVFGIGEVPTRPDSNILRTVPDVDADGPIGLGEGAPGLRFYSGEIWSVATHCLQNRIAQVPTGGSGTVMAVVGHEDCYITAAKMELPRGKTAAGVA
jgi:hypothetical protein